MTCGCQITDTTATVPLSSLMRHVVPYVGKVPHALGVDFIRQSYVELCRRSALLTQELVMDIVTGQTDYPLTPEAGYEVYMIGEVGNHNGYRRVDYWPAYLGPQWRYSVSNNNVLTLKAAPTQDSPGALKVRVALIPSACIDVIPESIAGPYGRGIAMGAVADLLEIPNKEWTAMGLAQRIRPRYYQTVQSARNLAETNRQAGPVRTHHRRVC